jgi:positive regulator of sigma E activity
MFKVKVEEVTYKLCEKCGVHRKPGSFRVKKQKRKSCSNCRSKK